MAFAKICGRYVGVRMYVLLIFKFSQVSYKAISKGALKGKRIHNNLQVHQNSMLISVQKVFASIKFISDVLHLVQYL